MVCFLTMTTPLSSSEAIRKSIHQLKVSVFTTRDIMLAAPDVSRALVDQVLSRMVRGGELERVRRGMFSLPKVHDELGRLAPQSQDITAAVERQIGAPIIPAGALALNELHLSTQVPVRLEFITAGPSQVLFVGKREIRLRHAPATRFRSRERIVLLVIEALRALGQKNITDSIISSLRKTLSEQDRLVLHKNIANIPVWMQRYIREVAQ